MTSQSAPSRLRRQGFLEASVLELALWVLMLLVVPAILCGKNLPAQTQVPQTTKPAQPPRAAADIDAASTRQPSPEAIAAPLPASPALVKLANKTRVRWDSRGLEIEASNSSLDQILHQVAANTGAKLEGLIGYQRIDQRIFGSYGPGPACDVLSKLLDGSGYNVLMTGCRNGDAPLAIILSARSPANLQTAANNQSRSHSKENEAAEQLQPDPQPDYPPETPRPQPIQNPFGNGEPPREPVQFMQEILQRQQKIDQQQQQDQQKNLHQ